MKTNREIIIKSFHEKTFPSQQSIICLSGGKARSGNIPRDISLSLSPKERITQRKSWQQFLQIMNLHNNLGPNKQKAHGNWDLTKEQTFLNSSDDFSARLRATGANGSDGAAKLKLVLFLRGKLAPTLLTPNSHQKATCQKVTSSQMARGGKGEWRNPRILNSSKQAFPRPPETEQQTMRGYPDISDVLPFKLF